MPFKTFTASVLSSSDVNTYLMKQSVITCTSGTRPASPVEGMLIYETDTDLMAIYDGSAWGYSLGGWQSYVPALTNITLGNGTVTGRWSRVGKMVTGFASFTAGSTTTYAASNLSVGLPTNTDASATNSDTIGSGSINNGSGATRRLVTVTANAASSSVVVLLYEGGTVTNAAPFAFGTSSQIRISFTYASA